jgi:disulfide bond formation protein DsbB
MSSTPAAETAPAGDISQEPKAGPGVWLSLALVVAVLGAAGSLWLSIGMGLKPCPLCFYQRSFMMSVVGVLGIGLAFRAGRLGLLALPLATAGLGVALFHVYLEAQGKLECPRGILGLGTAPQQSLAMFVLLFFLIGVDVLRGIRVGESRVTGLVSGLVLGGLFAVASCTSNPPVPLPPEERSRPEPQICRPPVRPQ